MLITAGAFVMIGVIVLVSFIGLQQESLTRQRVTGNEATQPASSSIYLQQHDATMTSNSGKPHSSVVSAGMPYVQGTQILDGTGHPLRRTVPVQTGLFDERASSLRHRRPAPAR